MTNIWAFLIQTGTVSFVAACILFLKRMLKDKLTPRWQYAVWSVLALRIILSVNVNRKNILPIPMWIEVLKTYVEKQMNSSFTAVYVPASITNIVPHWGVKPVSITDWLLVLYTIGIVVSVSWYIVSYMRLRNVLKRGEPVAYDMQLKLQEVCERYQLKSCNSIMIEGLDSAFVCGGIQSTLALPANREVDEKVLLHELLHLKYHDELQSIAWCIFRCLHWCNPFMQYIFNQIENDMETLCDQRVLELLEGEELRVYGLILLNMANDKYERVPGTSSISNGGKFISQRIEAIVRFKKYPKGMALVSVCSIILLLVPMIIGYAKTDYTPINNPYQIGPVAELDRAMVRARMDRCETIAGALDTYAKGLVYENGLYIAIASSYEKHRELENQMRKNVVEDGWRANYLYNGEMLEYVISGASNGTYGIYNLRKGENGKHYAYLRFSISDLLREDGTLHSSEGYSYIGALVFVPVAVWQEEGWVVEEVGERFVLTSEEAFETYYYTEKIPEKAEFLAEGETGTVRILVQSEHHIGEKRSSFRSSNLTEIPDLDAEFAEEAPFYKIEYTYHEDAEGNLPKDSVGIQVIEMQSPEEAVVFEKSKAQPLIIQSVYEGNGKLEGYSETYNLHFDNILTEMPKLFQVRITWDGEIVEELLVEEVLAK